MSDLERIKSKFQKIDSGRWWGDDYDVRFYLVNILKKIQKSIIVDIGVVRYNLPLFSKTVFISFNI